MRSSRFRRGASAIEFALVLPVLITLFGAVVELSLYVSTFHRVTRAARDAARVGSIVIEGPNADGTEIVDTAEQHASFVLEEAGYDCSGGCTVEATWLLDEDENYYYITVNIVYPYEPLTGLIPILEANGVRAQFTMMTQQQ